MPAEIRFRLSAALHKRVVTAAFDRGVSVAALSAVAIFEYLRTHGEPDLPALAPSVEPEPKAFGDDSAPWESDLAAYDD